MPRYTFKGDSPRSLPEHQIERVEPGQTIETLQAVEHPDFEPVTDKKSSKSEVKAEESKSEAKSQAQSASTP